MINLLNNLLYVACAYLVSPWVLILPTVDTLFTAFASWLSSREKDRQQTATIAELEARIVNMDDRIGELSVRMHQGRR